MKKEKITIYTDGSARGNPGKAGWGVVFLHGKEYWELGGRSNHATNNQMELTGVIEALEYIKKHKINSIIDIYSDSKYVILGITEWINGWIRNNWTNSAKKPVLNKELWQKLHKLFIELKPKFFYVAGHKENIHNNRADEIATSFADNAPVKLKK
ncbi:MAG: ribonuclease H [Candidatus Paceibacterota bacterium]|jgi:ribonuclease HI